MPTLICDLDGVVYLGDQEIVGSGKALARLEAAGWSVVFCTNNSTRTPHDAARTIERVAGYPARPDQVVTSAMAAASLLDPRESVYVVGGRGLVEAVEDRRCVVTPEWRRADAVAIGLDPDLTYERLSGAVLAIGRGARFVASNHDVTYPTPEGPRPGAGAIVAAVAAATGVDPEIAGKPHPPMRRLLAEKAVDDVIWIVGDRDDTDLAMGRAEGWHTAHVGTGVSVDSSEPVSLTAADLAEVVDHLLE